MLASGRGAPQNYTEGLKWYRKSADQGDANAQESLGVMYAKGNGVPQDYVHAYMWLTCRLRRVNKKPQKTETGSYVS
jgi:uncharacterized protein